MVLSALAVVVATILLVVWVVVGDGLVLVYAAMGLAVLSLVFLWVAKRGGSTAETAGPPPDHLAGSTASEPGTDHEAAARPESALPAATRPSRQAADPVTGVFPIGDYDSLWVSQIVPLLAGLDGDDLAVIEDRERQGRSRAAVLDAVAAARPTAATPAVRTSAGARDDERPGDDRGGLDDADDQDDLWTTVAPRDDDEKAGFRASIAPHDDEDDGLWTTDDEAESDDEADGRGPLGSGLVVAETVGATSAAEDLWLVDDREPFDGTGPGEPPAVGSADDPDGQVEVEAGGDGAGPLGSGVVVAETVGATSAAEDLWLAGDREPFDGTGPGERPALGSADGPEGGVDPEGQVEVEVEVVEVEVAAEDAEDEPESPRAGAAAAVGGSRVRTFLGRRRSRLTVRRG